MILFCRTMKLAIEEGYFERDMCQNPQKSGKFAQNGQEKMLKNAKSQKKNESNLVWQPCIS